jgi:vacuolar protein sorting-associated protein 11
LIRRLKVLIFNQQSISILAHSHFPYFPYLPSLIQISAFTVLDNLSQIAIGFANGTVLLLKGEMATGRSPKQRTIFESEEPITALGFTEDAKQTLLYIVTTNRIMTSITSGKGHGSPPRLLDALGCALGCVSFRDEGEMIVGRDDAVYLYGADSRVYAYEGIPCNFGSNFREKVCGFAV